MFEVIPAAFVCILVVLLVLKWNRGDFKPQFSNKSGVEERKVKAPNVPDGAPNFDEWASEALLGFDRTYDRIKKSGTCTGGDLALLREMRGSVLEEYNAQIRYSPNDDTILAELDESMRKADDYMTRRMRVAQSTNPSLIAIRGPMSCGDGDAFSDRFT
jgi:hypothetical protein